MLSFINAIVGERNKASAVVATDLRSAAFADAVLPVAILYRNLLPLKKGGDSFIPEQPKNALLHARDTSCIIVYRSTRADSRADVLHVRFS